MSDENESNQSPAHKKLKCAEDVKDVKDVKDGENGDRESLRTVHQKADISLSMFKFKRVLNCNAKSKMIVIEAECDDESAVIVMEKSAFNEQNARQLLKDRYNETGANMTRDFHNDVYGNYVCLVSPQLNTIKTSIIHPASDKHILKYSSQCVRLVMETPHIYNTITLPHIESKQFSLNWVLNILEHRNEKERIVYEDDDPEIGFVLLPDMKWDGKQLENFYLVAICKKLGIRSLRDLNDTHLPLLLNIKNKGCEAIQTKYGIVSSSVRIYIHYQPSYYHFHVHFTALTYEDSGCNVERAHLIDTVINNISLCSDYYRQSTLAFPIKQNDELYPSFVSAHLIQ